MIASSTSSRRATGTSHGVPSYAPHLTVYDNIAFSLRLRKTPKDEIEKRVRERRASSGSSSSSIASRGRLGRPAAAGCDGPSDRARSARVPDGRAALEPRREAARADARRDLGHQRDLKTTTIYVTHDQVEAMTMGDRVAVMRKGELQQVASPQDLYDNPVNLFVGGFIGSPAMNMVEATHRARERRVRLKTGDQSIAIGDEVLKDGRRSGRTRDARSCSGSAGGPRGRFDQHRHAGRSADPRPRRPARGARLGDHGALHGRGAACRHRGRPRAGARHRRRERCRSESASEPHSTVVGRFSPRTEVRPGDVIEVAVETRSLHFFDRDTGMGIYKEQDSTKGAGT